MFKAGNRIDDDSDDDIDVTAADDDNVAAADGVDANHLVDNNIEVIEDEANSRNLILYEIITPGSYIGLRSPPESLEILFAARVVSKDVATEHIEDMNGHRILPGERYVTVEYLEKYMENASEVKYKLVKMYSFKEKFSSQL